MNFFSYSHYHGIQYHQTGAEAKTAVEDALRIMAAAPAAMYSREDMTEVVWGEVTERAASTGETGYALKRQVRLSYEAAHPQVVDGRMEDADGSLVLLRNIHETDMLYNDLVLSIAPIWKDLSGKIQRFKQHNFEDVATVLDLLYEKHKVTRGGKEGNMQFFTFDRRYKLRISIQKQIDFGPELQVAQTKLLEAVEQMGSNDDTNVADLKALVLGGFTLRDGKVCVSKVLSLRRIKVSSVLWNEGLQIIDEAILVISRKKQILLYERNEQGEYIAIPLDIAAL